MDMLYKQHLSVSSWYSWGNVWALMKLTIGYHANNYQWNELWICSGKSVWNGHIDEQRNGNVSSLTKPYHTYKWKRIVEIIARHYDNTGRHFLKTEPTAFQMDWNQWSVHRTANFHNYMLRMKEKQLPKALDGLSFNPSRTSLIFNLASFTFGMTQFESITVLYHLDSGRELSSCRSYLIISWDGYSLNLVSTAL